MTAPQLAVTPFVFDNRQVRTVSIDGQPWFVIADLCAILEIQNARDVAAKNLRKDDVAKVYVSGLPQGRRMLVTNEPGVYRLILRSNKPEAEKFQDWVCREVIPSIRKNGQFSVEVPAVSASPKPWEKIFSDSFRRNLFRLLGIAPDPSGKTPLRVGKAYWHLLYNRVGNGVSETLRTVNPRAPHKPWRLRQLHRHLAQGEATDRFKIMAVKCEAVMGCFETYTAFLSHWDTLYPPIGSLPRGLKAQLADNRQLLLRFE